MTAAVRIDEKAIQTYRRHGVVCLRGVFEQSEVERLRPIAQEAREDRAKYGLLPNVPIPRYLARTVPAVRRFVFESTLGEVCGRVLQSSTIRFFFDEVFAKPPGSTRPTIWHADRPGWPVTGHMVPSVWIPLTPVSKRNSLECIAGSHRHDRMYWLYSPNSRQMIRPSDRPIAPNVEALRGAPGLTFLTWDMVPGDCLIVHPWTLHYSSGNPSSDWRIALSIRVFGDDIRWEPRPDCLNIAGVSFDEMVPGEAPSGPLFPLLWSVDGASDTDRDYPRGFATHWGTEAYSRLRELSNPTVAHDGILAQDGGGSTLSLEELAADIRWPEPVND
jgi:ectoine hydroxylase-related dioxygenase (phytanoyl-CoA dioxygenase family)